MNPLDKHFGRFGNRMFQSAYIYTQFRDGIIPDIFLQDPKYFDKYRTELQNLFNEGIIPTKEVAIHVRRGLNPSNLNEPKYSENPFYVNLSNTNYYDRAIELFPDDNFLVFSDDIEFCKTKFKGERFKFIEGQTEMQDFYQMAGCRHQIIANSSFSYWAAYLNTNSHKKVIFPKNWYSDGITRTKCPAEWIEI